MTYRERRMAKAERLREWADKREAKAAAVFKAGEPSTGDIAFNTQPGHIPFRARLIAREDRAHESLAKARAMNARAAGIEAQADRAIYSDDPDACESLAEKLAGLEAERAEIKRINAALRKGAPFASVPMSDRQRCDLIDLARLTPYYQPLAKGFPPYKAQNLSGNIARLRKRLAEVTALAEQRAKVAAMLEAESADA